VNSDASAEASGLMYLFGSFKPSERAVLLEVAIGRPDQFLSALDLFLLGWAKSTWVEEYNVERVGEWISKNCPPQLVERCRDLAISSLGSNDSLGPHQTASVHATTYRSFLVKIVIAREFA
jgi:hypothetical protein